MWRLLSSLVLGLSLSMAVSAQEVVAPGKIQDPPAANVPAAPAPAPAVLVSNANEFPVILQRMMAQLNYRPGLGHSVAAAKMVNCQFEMKAEAKADLLNQTILALNFGDADNFRRRRVYEEIELAGDIRNSGQAARLAAVLACKVNAKRSLEQVINDFDAALAEVEAFGKKATNKDMVPRFYMLNAVAELMN